MKINSVVEKVLKSEQSYPYIGEDPQDKSIMLCLDNNNIICLHAGLKGYTVGKTYDHDTSHYKPTAKHVILSNDLLA